MPALLYGIGAFALFVGLVMIGFGIPINEFSFGNTLISAGTTAVVGGLVLFGLGVVAGQLRRVAEALVSELPARLTQPIGATEDEVGARPVASPDRMAYPSKPKFEPELGDLSPSSSGNSFDERAFESLSPALKNPDQPAVAAEVALSPPHAGAAGYETANRNREPAFRSPPGPAAAPPPRPLHSANFDAMWPAEAKFPKIPAGVESEAKPRETTASPRRVEPEKPRAAAILKSGVVDGMGYTLYVDGSIEAELPQGTLRFASINELRSHLAKHS
jgi:hypothetical protein